MYAEIDRKKAFDFFVDNYQELYKKYGHKFLAIKDKSVLGYYDAVQDAISDLSDNYELGSHIIQECTGDESAYRAVIMRFIIKV